jgi:hypothetical protein
VVYRDVELHALDKVEALRVSHGMHRGPEARDLHAGAARGRAHTQVVSGRGGAAYARRCMRSDRPRCREKMHADVSGRAGPRPARAQV